MLQHKETIKTIALTLLIGAIIGFISGVKAVSYTNSTIANVTAQAQASK